MAWHGSGKICYLELENIKLLKDNFGNPASGRLHATTCCYPSCDRKAVQSYIVAQGYDQQDKGFQPQQKLLPFCAYTTHTMACKTRQPACRLSPAVLQSHP
jgi:hypothetical protein